MQDVYQASQHLLHHGPHGCLCEAQCVTVCIADRGRLLWSKLLLI